MSADPEAMLYYGFPIGEPDFDYHDANDAWEELHRPAKPEHIKGYSGPEWDQWRIDFQNWCGSPQNIKLNWHGSEDCEQYHVHCKALVKSVEWSEYKEIDLEELAKPQPEADLYLGKFCEQNGIEWKQPKWFLAARYF